MRVLFVCEANRTRSPVAAALWDRELARLADTAPSGSRSASTSAGTHAVPGERASRQTSWEAARHGLDLTAHRSRPLDDDLVAEADLILTMTRDQGDHVGMNHRRVSDRLFLISDIAALLRMSDAGAATTRPVPAPLHQPARPPRSRPNDSPRSSASPTLIACCGASRTTTSPSPARTLRRSQR